MPRNRNKKASTAATVVAVAPKSVAPRESEVKHKKSALPTFEAIQPFVSEKPQGSLPPVSPQERDNEASKATTPSPPPRGRTIECSDDEIQIAEPSIPVKPKMDIRVPRQQSASPEHQDSDTGSIKTVDLGSEPSAGSSDAEYDFVPESELPILRKARLHASSTDPRTSTSRSTKSSTTSPQLTLRDQQRLLKEATNHRLNELDEAWNEQIFKPMDRGLLEFAKMADKTVAGINSGALSRRIRAASGWFKGVF